MTLGWEGDVAAQRRALGRCHGRARKTIVRLELGRPALEVVVVGRRGTVRVVGHLEVHFAALGVV